MADVSSLPPPTGPRYPGVPPRGVAEPRDDRDVFAAPASSESGRSRPTVLPAPQFPSGLPPFLAAIGPGSTDIAILDVPGAAEPVTLVGLDGGDVKLYVGQRRGRVESFSNGAIVIPMLQGGVLRLKYTESLIGYPVVKFHGQVIYRAKKPPIGDRFTIQTMRFMPLLIGLIPGYFVGLYSAQWVAGMVKRGEPLAMRRVLPLSLTLGVVFLGALLIAVSVLATA